MWFALHYLYVPAVVLCLEQPRVEIDGEIGERFHFRRAVDGTRGRKYFDPVADGSYDSYGSAGGNYDYDQEKLGFFEFRSNVPGEPGVSYPTYTSVPRTRFSCEGRKQGYYADEESGCQAFYVCNNVVVASFICPVGSIFSQGLLTCDWWNKVDCGMTSSFASLRQQSYNNDAEMVQKAYKMMQPPEANRVENYQQTGARRRLKVKKVRVKPNSVSEFATTGDRERENYNNFQTSEPQVRENYPIGWNGFEDNRQSQKDIVNVQVQPQEFVVNHREREIPAKESSIIYIKKTDEVSSQKSYTPSRPSVFGNNLQNNYRQQDVYDFGNRFKSSYAPTVPTVTTTMRKFYSPTVPTPYKLSTISYDDYDQYFEGSRNLYSSNDRGVDLSTTPETTAYKYEGEKYLRNSNGEQLNQSDETITERIENPKSLPENVETENRSAFRSEQIDSVLVATDTGINENENKEKINTSNTLNSRQNISPLFAQIPRPVGSPARPEVDITDQLIGRPFDEQPRLTLQLSQPIVSSELQSPEDSNDASPRITSFISQTPNSSALPKIQSSEASEDKNPSETLTRIPSLIFRVSQFLRSPEMEIPRISDSESISRASRWIPGWISQILKRSVNSIAQNLKASDSQNVFDVPVRIPPLIPQAAQSASSSGAQDPSEITANTNVDAFVPLQFFRTSQSDGSSEIDSTAARITLQTLETSTRIPPLIPQAVQSGSPSGVNDPSEIVNGNIDVPVVPPQSLPTFPTDRPSEMDSTDANIDSQSPETSTRIAPLIPQAIQSTSSSGVKDLIEINLNDNIDVPLVLPLFLQTLPIDRSSGMDSIAARIPPLIPQTVQSASSSGATDPSEINANSNIDVPSVQTPISEIPQTNQPLEMDFTDAPINTQTLETSTGIPPLMLPDSQFIEPGRELPTVTSGSSTTRGPPRITDLFSQTPQPSTASDSRPSVASDDQNASDESTRIPLQTTQPAPSSGVQDPSEINGNGNNDVTFEPPLILQTFPTDRPSETDSTTTPIGPPTPRPPGRIPPLIFPSLPSVIPTGIGSSSVTSDDGNTRAPPSSEMDSTDEPISPQTPGPPGRIPPLVFPSLPAIMPTGTGSPSVANDDSITRRPPLISSLIPQTTQSSIPSESMFSTDNNNNPDFNGPTDIMPPQSSQSESSSGGQSLSGTNDNSNSDVSAPPLLIPLVPQNIEPARVEPASPFFPQIPEPINPGRMNSTDVATKIPLLIPQVPNYVTPSNVQPTDGTGNENNEPPKTPFLSSQTPESSTSSGSRFGTDSDKQFFDIPSNMPSTINQATIPLASLGPQFTDIISQKDTSLPPIFDFNYEIQSFNPLTGSVPATVVRFQGRYQNPSPFIQFQAPTGLPGQQFVIGSTSDRAVYDFYRERGSRPNIGTKTLRLPARSEGSKTEGFKTNIPDLFSAEDENSKDTFVRSTLGNVHSLDANSSKTSAQSSTVVNVSNIAAPFPKLNDTDQFQFGLSTTNHSQSKLFDRTSSATNLFSTKFGDSFSTSTTTQPKAATFAPFALNFNGSRYSSLQQTVSTEPKNPTSAPFTLNSNGSRYSSLQQTVSTEPKTPTFTPFNLNSDGSRYSSLQQTVSTEPKTPTFTPFNLNSDGSRYSSLQRTVSTEPKTPTSAPFTLNLNGSRYSSLQQTVSTEPKTRTFAPFTLNLNGSRYSSLQQTVSTEPKTPTSTPFNLNSDGSRYNSLQQTVSTEPKTPTFAPFTLNLNGSRFGSFKQTGSIQPKVPTSSPFAFNSNSSRFSSLKQTVPVQPKPPTSAPFASISDGSRFSSLKQTVPAQPKAPTFAPFTSISGGSRFSSFKQTVSAQPKAPTSASSTPLSDGNGFSSFKQAVPAQPKSPTPSPFTLNSDGNRFGSFKQTAPTQPKAQTSTPLTLNVEGNSYNSFRQIERPIGQTSTPVEPPENQADLVFAVKGASGGYPALASPQPTSPPNTFENSRFASGTPRNIGTGGLNKPPENLRETKKEPPKGFRTTTTPPELPEGLSEFEAVPRLNDDSPYEIRFTVNADEDFVPSEEFISKILAEQVSSESSGLDGLQGYEIIRSDSPDGSGERKNVKPITAANIQRTANLLQSPSTASANLLESQRIKQSRFSPYNPNRDILRLQATQDPVRNIEPGYALYNSNRDIPRPEGNRNPVPRVESLNPDVYPRPFFFVDQANLPPQVRFDPRFNYPSIDPSVFDGNIRYEDLRNGLDYSKVRINPDDINGSLKSLFESSPRGNEIPPPHMELILDELKKYFGEPLYRSNSQISFVKPDRPQSTGRKSKQQFAERQRYRVSIDPASGQQQSSISPQSQRPTATTTTTTPAPGKSFVQTEFIPSLSFSFDYDEGRQQYVEAVLQGLLTEDKTQQPLSNAADSNKESSQK